MRILVDMDDTIEDLLPAWVNHLNKVHGTAVHPEDIVDWDIEQFFPQLTKSQIFAPLYDSHFWTTVKPKPGAAEQLKRLKDDGHEVYVVTSTNHKTLDAKINCILIPYFGSICRDDVIVTSHKQLINGDVLVDDNPYNLLGGVYAGILFDAPHNRKFSEKEFGIVRVNTWEDVYKAINNLGGKDR